MFRIPPFLSGTLFHAARRPRAPTLLAAAAVATSVSAGAVLGADFPSDSWPSPSTNPGSALPGAVPTAPPSTQMPECLVFRDRTSLAGEAELAHVCGTRSRTAQSEMKLGGATLSSLSFSAKVAYGDAGGVGSAAGPELRLNGSVGFPALPGLGWSPAVDFSLGRLAAIENSAGNIDQQLRLSLKGNLFDGWSGGLELKLGALSDVDLGQRTERSSRWGFHAGKSFTGAGGRPHKVDLDLSLTAVQPLPSGPEQRTTRAALSWEHETRFGSLGLAMSYALEADQGAAPHGEGRAELKFKMPF